MKKSALVCGTLLALSSILSASPTLVTGTPNYLGSGLAPTFGNLINFDDLATAVGTSGDGMIPLPAAQYVTSGVSSITNNGSALLAATFSQQSAPVYLTTGASDNYAGDITIRLAKAVNLIGIGILSDDTSPVSLNALGADGGILASFRVFTSATSATPENGYWAISDKLSDIQGLEVISPANLGIDDLQLAVPEPSGLALVLAGALLIAVAQIRRRVQKGRVQQ